MGGKECRIKGRGKGRRLGEIRWWKRRGCEGLGTLEGGRKSCGRG